MNCCKIVNNMTAKPVYETIFGRYKEDKPVKSTWNLYQVKFPGDTSYRTKHKIRLAYHNELEFHYIKRGGGSYFIKNRKYPFSKNHLVIIKPGEIHTFIPGTPSFIEKGSLYFLPSFLPRKELKFITGKCPHIVRLTEKEATLAEILLKSIGEEAGGREEKWENIVKHEVMLFLSIAERASVRKSICVRKNPLTEKIMDFMEQNFAQNLPVSEIAKTFSLSASRISHIFKQETGLSLKNYILQRRIVEAKKLLSEDAGMKVSAVSIRTGFNDFTLFNRSFKNITGMTPTSYRRISMQNRD